MCHNFTPVYVVDSRAVRSFLLTASSPRPGGRRKLPPPHKQLSPPPAGDKPPRYGVLSQQDGRWKLLPPHKPVRKPFKRIKLFNVRQMCIIVRHFCPKRICVCAGSSCFIIASRFKLHCGAISTTKYFSLQLFLQKNCFAAFGGNNQGFRCSCSLFDFSFSFHASISFNRLYNRSSSCACPFSQIVLCRSSSRNA